MGNICRSPLAEGVFEHKADLRGVRDRFTVDSAGTGRWHVGEPPDPRACEIAARNGVLLTGRARRVTRGDFGRFHHLVCMDEYNRRDLARLGAPAGKLRLLLEVDPSAVVREVPDPYYGGDQGFEIVYELIDSACEALLDDLLAGVP
jgi:protein-tyrosine phosphatase